MQIEWVLQDRGFRFSTSRRHHHLGPQISLVALNYEPKSSIE